MTEYFIEQYARLCKFTVKTETLAHCKISFAITGTPYWSQGAQKQYYVSKRCSAKDACVKTRNRYMRYCTHIWYEDWKCSECCQGDRCNYYVIVSIGSEVGLVLYILCTYDIRYSSRI
jgi:hypothetical protein